MPRKNPAAVALGRRGGKALLKERGPEYFAALQARRTTFAGRPSIYDPLTEFLQRQTADRIKLTFDDIEDEDVIGLELPDSARTHRPWWGNEVRSASSRQCRAWLKPGWKVNSVDLSAEYVVFVRQQKPTAQDKPENGE
jgi:hypothetical protein